jgi:hypothetical protein
MHFVNRLMGADYLNDDFPSSLILPLGRWKRFFLDVLCPLRFMPSCHVFGLSRGGNKNLSPRVLCYTREIVSTLMMSRYEILASLSRSEEMEQSSRLIRWVGFA